MANFPYITNQQRVKKFFEGIPKKRVPDKVTLKYLKEIGYSSTNDRPLIPISKFVGFVDNAGVPTAKWQQYRDERRAKYILAEGIREGYSGLFNLYDDAYRKDEEALKSYFRENTTVSDSVVTLIVRTFKTLCEMADFSGDRMRARPTDSEITEKQTESPEPGLNEIQMNINIQLTLPESKDPEVYELLFKALAEHVLKKKR